MPFKSQATPKIRAVACRRQNLQSAFEERNRETGGKTLPERVGSQVQGLKKGGAAEKTPSRGEEVTSLDDHRVDTRRTRAEPNGGW